jgi:large subunit ribosomal protein L6e
MTVEVCKSVGKFGRAKTYKRRGLWAIKAKNGGKFPVHAKKAPVESAATKPPKFYPSDDVRPKLPKNSNTQKPAKLKATITPGTVLIVLTGRFRGKRVVFLKQLESGLLMVSGPFKVNGVPLRRFNQAFVIGTSTKIDISGVDVSKYTDSYFAKPSGEKKEKGQDEDGESKKEIAPEKIEDQKAVDGALLPLIEGVPELKGYLGTVFTLKSGQKPHAMKF